MTVPAITRFANDTTPALPDLDENFDAFGLLAPIPVAASGINDLTLTQQTSGAGPDATSIALQAYVDHVQVCFIAVATNTTIMTARVGSLAAIKIYKDTAAGTVALSGGEVVLGNAITLIYDSALDSGNGGWHLVSITANVGSTITPALVRASLGVQFGPTVAPTLTNIQSALATLAFTSLVPNSTQDQSFSMASVNFGDALAFGFPSLASAGLTFSGFIAAAGTVAGSVFATIAVRCANVTAASTITPGTMTIRATSFRCV
jgi:hypothetical protein